MQEWQKKKVKKTNIAKSDTNPNRIQLIGNVKMVDIWMTNLVAVRESEDSSELCSKDF